QERERVGHEMAEARMQQRRGDEAVERERIPRLQTESVEIERNERVDDLDDPHQSQQSQHRDESRQMVIAVDAGVEVRDRRVRAAAGGGGAGVGAEEDSGFLSGETRGSVGAHGAIVGEEAWRTPKNQTRRANVIVPLVPLSSRYVLLRTDNDRVLPDSGLRPACPMIRFSRTADPPGSRRDVARRRRAPRRRSWNRSG